MRACLFILADTHPPETLRFGRTLSGRMRLTLADESLLPVLLAFFRSAGCVAYYEGGGIEAVRMHSFGDQEANELRAIARRWQAEHPEAQIDMSA